MNTSFNTAYTCQHCQHVTMSAPGLTFVQCSNQNCCKDTGTCNALRQWRAKLKQYPIFWDLALSALGIVLFL